MSTISKAQLSEEDLLQLADDGLRHELIQGELTSMPPSGSEHGYETIWIGRIVSTHILDHDLGFPFGAEAGFIIDRDPDTVRAPDFAFVRKERVPGGRLPKGFFPGAPDLAVEVLSPWDRAVEVEDKIQQWLDAGTRQVWVVNLRRRTLTVHRRDQPAQVLRADDNLDGGDLLPNFRIKVAQLLPPDVTTA
ncbi:MAG: Uma2 family endonuclease [Planctomycetota bacterium]